MDSIFKTFAAYAAKFSGLLQKFTGGVSRFLQIVGNTYTDIPRRFQKINVRYVEKNFIKICRDDHISYDSEHVLQFSTEKGDRFKLIDASIRERKSNPGRPARARRRRDPPAGTSATSAAKGCAPRSLLKEQKN